jgi:hypothetical protein
MEFDIWKPLLAEFNTHGLLGSRNFPSSRAIPWPKMREKILTDPHIPVFRKNNPGMQPAQPLSPDEQALAARRWLRMRDVVLEEVEFLGDKDGLNIHKQWLNRPLESWITVTGIVTATDWENFWNLRTELNDSDLPMAQDEFYWMSCAMKKALDESNPKPLAPGEWHTPYVIGDPDDWITNMYYHGDTPHSMEEIAALVSAGRCATVSYDNLGQGVDPMKDYKRAVDQLLPFGHMSVFQHQARCMEEFRLNADEKWLRFALAPALGWNQTSECWWGQLRGWGQFRKSLPSEAKWVSPRADRQVALDVPELLTI